MTTPAPMPDFAGKVTNPAVRSGAASDPAVWTRPPQDGDWLGVPADITVTWDYLTSPRLAGVAVAGTLDCGTAPGDKRLDVGTLFVNETGTLVAGDCTSETPLAGTLTVTFLDGGFDPDDPGQFGRGLLVAGGTLNLCGAAAKLHGTSWAPAVTRAMSVALDADPVGWELGDWLFLPSCSPGDGKAPQDDVVQVDAVNGRIVSFAYPPKFSHQPPPGRLAYVVNLTRKIVFRSENPAGTRGHVMLMRGMGGMPPTVNTCHVLSKDMGRTSALTAVTDPQLDSMGVLVPGTDTNPRARYGWHAHKCGQSAAARQVWDGIVVWGGKKWGFDNHDSNVLCTHWVGVQCQGAIAATERGSEIGCYNDGFGFRTLGSGLGVEDRINQSDFGHDSYGLWLQGPGVTAAGNVYGGAKTGEKVYCRGLDPKNIGVLTPTFNGQPISLSAYTGWVDNLSLCCDVGHGYEWCGPTPPATSFHPAPNIGTRLRSWGCPTGVLMMFTFSLKLDQPDLLGPDWAAGSIGVNCNNGYATGMAVVGGSIKGFEVGVVVPSRGYNYFDPQGGESCNVRGYQFFHDTLTQSVITEFLSEPTFQGVPAASLGTRQQVGYFVPDVTDGLWAGPDAQPLDGIFTPCAYLLPNGRQLFCRQQGADFTLFPAPPVRGGKVYPLPLGLAGLTNAQLHDQFGLSLSGAVADASAAPGPTTNGLIGPRVPAAPHYWNYAGENPKSLSNYLLKWADNGSGNNVVSDPTGPITLAPGWQTLTRAINGAPYTFFVLGPGTAPPPAPVATAVSGASSVAMPSVRDVTLSFTLTAANGMAVNEGTVNCTIGQNGMGVRSGTAAVSGGVATVALPSLPLGTYAVSATYADAAGTFTGSTTNLLLVVT